MPRQQSQSSMHVENRERLVRLETLVETLGEDVKEINAKVTSLLETRTAAFGAWKFTSILAACVGGLVSLVVTWLKVTK